MNSQFKLPVVALAILGGCATLPSGPSVTVLPGSSKGFDQFRADDHACRQYGQEQIGGVTPNQAANESVEKSAVAGTVLGAAAGAAIDGGHGAAIGAGIGLLFGSAAGSSAGYASAHAAQQRYDAAYIQCMYAKGNKVPVSGRMIAQPPRGHYPPPPGRGTPPPPDFYPVPPS
jgi:hypothetical protein